jgi:hypothetical protein
MCAKRRGCGQMSVYLANHRKFGVAE